MLKSIFCGMVLCLFANASISQVGSEFEGPYFGKVTRVVDGDNFEAKVEIWPTISATVSVRVRGFDAPEKFRPQCPQERLGAAEAEQDMVEILPIGTLIRLENVVEDSFAGRVIADAFRQGPDRGRTILELMINRGNVVRWTPSDGAVDWCNS